MIFGSVCSGIEAASVAWKPLGWRAAFVSEVDAFPSAVLAHHHPEAPNLGDFTTIQHAPEPIKLLVGGTPCQDFSVAGLRAGMGGERGNLTLEFLRLAGRLRPEWVVWENVPGVLSIDGGRAFGAFLGGLVQLGYGFAYRVLDAQHFGVPQRRRRVFVVGHLGDWRRAAAVLFERDSLSGNPPPCREARAVVASSLTRSLGSGGACAGRAQANHLVPGGTLTAHTLRADGFDASEDGTGRGTPLVVVPAHGETAFCLPASSRGTGDGHGQGWNSNYVLGDPQAYQCHGNNVGPMGTIRKGDGGLTSGVPFIVNAAESCAKQLHARESETARCIDSTGSFANAQGGTVVMQPIPFDTTQITSGENRSRPEPGDCCHPLSAAAHAPAIAFHERGREGGRNLECQEDQAYALRAISGGGCGDWMRVAHRQSVRWLTPRECERLQGFPDDYTLIPTKPVPAKSQAKSRVRLDAGDERFVDVSGVIHFASADGPRYKALGNSMAVPVMRWIGERIVLAGSL